MRTLLSRQVNVLKLPAYSGLDPLLQPEWIECQFRRDLDPGIFGKNGSGLTQPGCVKTRKMLADRDRIVFQCGEHVVSVRYANEKRSVRKRQDVKNESFRLDPPDVSIARGCFFQRKMERQKIFGRFHLRGHPFQE